MSTGEDFVVHSSEVGPPDCPNPCMVRIPESPPDHELTTEAKSPARHNDDPVDAVPARHQISIHVIAEPAPAML